MSQHGADTHAWDPLAHLRRDDDRDGRGGPAGGRGRAPARRRALAGDRWRRLRRVPGRAADLEPRLAGRGASRGARRRRPSSGANDGRPRARRYGQAPLPATFEDPPNAGRGHRTRRRQWPRRRSLETVGARSPAGRAAAAAGGAGSRLVGSARRRLDRAPPRRCAARRGVGHPAIDPSRLDAATWERLMVAPRVVAPSDPAARSCPHRCRDRATARSVNGRGRAGRSSSALAVAGPSDDHGARELLALGVAPPSASGASAAGSSRRASPATAARRRRNTRPRSPLAERDPSNRSTAGFARRSRGACSRRAGFAVAPPTRSPAGRRSARRSSGPRASVLRSTGPGVACARPGAVEPLARQTSAGARVGPSGARVSAAASIP